MKRHGFTLIELLVVIAIIAILAAILFPVFASAKERSRQTRCVANLKQLGMSFSGYMDDHQGRLPASSVVTNTPGQPVVYTPTDWCGSTWHANLAVQKPVDLRNGQIWKYARNEGIFMCPTDFGVAPCDPQDPWLRGCKDYPLSYSMNSWLSLVKLDSIPNRRPTRIMLLIHEGRQTINDGKFSMWSTDIPAACHWEGTTVLYCDGHAKYGSQKSLRVEMSSNHWNPNYVW